MMAGADQGEDAENGQDEAFYWREAHLGQRLFACVYTFVTTYLKKGKGGKHG